MQDWQLVNPNPRLGCHGLPIATGRSAGAGHVDRANRVCLACDSGTALGVTM